MTYQLATPVVFLIFNRPDTTAQVFAEIARAKPLKLLVVADGPRADRPGEAEKCQAVRAIIEQVDWPCEVLTNYAETNMGCGQRVSSGLDWVFSQVEEAIILEDDCVPQPTFFPFCQILLEKYRDDERVMMISGTNYLSHLDIPESYTFSRFYAIWGWATWRRAWAKYDFKMTHWPEFKSQKQLDYFYPQKYVVKWLTKTLDLAYQGQLDTWGVPWFYNCLFNNGLTVVPRVNLISNIGAVGTHTTEGLDEIPLPTFALETNNFLHPHHVFANVIYDATMFEQRIKIPKLTLIRIKIFALRRKLIRVVQRMTKKR